MFGTNAFLGMDPPKTTRSPHKFVKICDVFSLKGFPKKISDVTLVFAFHVI